MEHIIQFGVTIDDDKVEKEVIRRASEECIKEVERIARADWNGNSQLKCMFEKEVKEVVANNKDEIIEKIVKQVSLNLMKTNAFKEAQRKVLADESTR